MKYRISFTTDSPDYDALEEAFPDAEDVEVESIAESPAEHSELREHNALKRVEDRRERHFDLHGHF